MYSAESQLVKDLESILDAQAHPFPQMQLAFEFNYISGKVDIIGATTLRELISFEAKLKSTFKGTTHESSVKQDGSLSYDLKWDILEVTSNHNININKL